MGSTMISILKIKITEADFKKIEDSILEISRGKHELRPVSKSRRIRTIQRQRLQNRDDHQS
jgi:hypothetical protein